MRLDIWQSGELNYYGMKRTVGILFFGLFVTIASGQQSKVTLRIDSTEFLRTLPQAQKSSPIINFGQPVPQNYYTQHLGFFCRQELKMQQAKVPVTFRLGSMDECNRLEQKPGYR
jgi:hypothetical protein